MANFIDGTPTVTNKNVTDFTINVKTDVGDTVRYLLVPKDATPPTASEISNSLIRGTYSDVIDKTNLLTHLGLNGDLVDKSVNNIAYTSSSGTQVYSTDKDSQANGSVLFDASYSISNSLIPITILPTFSILIWVYPTVSEYNGICSMGANADNKLRLLNNYSGKLAFGSTADSFETPTSVLPLNTWKHIVVTLDSAKSLKFYIDGVLNSTFTVANNLINVIGGYITVGDTPFGTGFKGKIDEFRYYNGECLTQEKITTIYQAGVNTQPIRSGQITTLANTLTSRVVG